MLYYLLHQTPIWNDIADGKRNVRLIPIAACLYLLIHVIAFEYKDTTVLGRVINGWLHYVIAIDIVTMACVYKEHYGRSIIKELDDNNSDIYDTNTHKFNTVTDVTPSMDTESIDTE